jgi:hypothetical protein
MTMLNSRIVEAAAGLPASTLRVWGGQLFPGHRGRQGQRREWRMADSITVLVAQQMCDRGLLTAAALEIARAMQAEVSRLIADDNARCWIVAAPDPTEPDVLNYAIGRQGGADELLEAIAAAGGPSMCFVFDLRKMVGQAMAAILMAQRAKGSGHA